MPKIKDRLTPEQIQFLRSMFREPQQPYGYTLEEAKKEADTVTERTGMMAWVIRRKNKYEAVYEGFFDTYKYRGKIYYQTDPNEV